MKNRKSDSGTFVNPHVDPTSVGNILLSRRMIDRSQLKAALEAQARAQDHLLGALLIEAGHVSDLDVANALKTQAELRVVDRKLDLLDRVLGEAEANVHAVGAVIDRAQEAARDAGEATGVFLLAAVRAA